MKGGALLLLLAMRPLCGFPEVPPQNVVHGGVLEPVPGPRPESSRQVRGAPVLVDGLVVGNGTSHVVVKSGAEYLQLEIGPQTRVQIGSSPVGSRAVLPGSDVRVVYQPGSPNVAVSIEADPGRIGWDTGRAYESSSRGTR